MTRIWTVYALRDRLRTLPIYCPDSSGRPTKRCQPALAWRAGCGLDALVAHVEQPLQLAAGQRTTLRTPLVVGHMGRGVPLVTDLAWHRPHPLLALGDPPVTRIAHVVQEPADRVLVGPHRRVRPPVGGHPRLELRFTPRPRPALRELHEPAHHPLAIQDRRPSQPARQLLAAPPAEQLFEQRCRFGLGRARAHQRQPGRTPRDLAHRRRLPPPTLNAASRHPTQPNWKTHPCTYRITNLRTGP